MRFILKVSLAFAVLGYLIALALYFAPVGWRIPAAIVYAICPPAIMTITVDPSFSSVVLILGPLNALVYAAVGFAIGVVLSPMLKRGSPNC
jgi:hypothetical protein